MFTGLTPGQSLLVNTLTQDEVEGDYRSDASVDFVPYIANPASSLDLVERWLRKRYPLHKCPALI
jgi:hypothetical protein